MYARTEKSRILITTILQDLPEELKIIWNELVKITEDTNYEQNVTDLLIEMDKKPPMTFQPPLHMASKNGDLALGMVSNNMTILSNNFGHTHFRALKFKQSKFI